jgi:hypothetical protein
MIAQLPAEGATISPSCLSDWRITRMERRTDHLPQVQVRHLWRFPLESIA